jgi:RHS repeat-associated protein
LSARGTAAAVPAFAALAALLGAGTAAADPHPNVAGGIDVAQPFQVGDIDNINLFNGALTVAIPVGISYPVNGGFSYQLHLVANSNPWDFSTRNDPVTDISWKDSNPTACSNAGLGWRVSLGALTGAGMASSHVCVPTDGQGYGSFAVYEAPDGSQHPFYATLHPGEPDDFFNGVQDNAQIFVENVTYTRDGSYLRLKYYTSGNYFEIEFPNGNVHRFSGTDGSIVQMRDAFGNQLNVAYPSPGSCTGFQAGESTCWQLSDSQGRTHSIYFRSDLAPYNGVAPYGSLINRVVLQSFGGAPATYQFSYQVVSVRRGCPFSDTTMFSDQVQVPLLVQVNQPDGSSYAPGAGGYLETAGSGCLDGSGSLTALTLPTLGSLGWTYQRYVYPNASSPRPRHTANPGVQTRSSYDAYGNLIGAWSYATSLNPNELVNAVTDPLGNQHVRYFSVNTTPTFGPGANLYDYGRQYTPNTTYGSLFLSEKVIDAAGILRRTDYVRYERDVIDNYPVPDVLNDNGREAQRETFYDDGAGAGTTDQDFDGVGHYRQRTTDGSFAGNNTRIERHQFNPARGTYSVNQSSNTQTGNYLPPQPTDPWVLTTAPYEYAQENGVSELRSFCYDPNTGFLERRRLHTQSTTVPGVMMADNDVVQQFVADGSGNLARELYFGGDNARFPPTNEDLCQQTLPASPEYEIDRTPCPGVGVDCYVQYSGANFFSLKREVDASTGLVTASYDTANIKTQYQYDTTGMGRLVYVRPRDGGWTQYLYHLAASPSSLASLTVQQQQNGSASTVLAQTKYFYDALGRMIKKQILMPDGSPSEQTTSYNAVGWKTAVSEQGSPNVNLTQYLNYDPFGRAGLIRPPDSTPANGFAHDVTISYAGNQTVNRTVRVGTGPWNGTSVSETSASTTEIHDRFGRLASVTESSGNSGAPVTTSYSYDPGGRLTQTSTTAAGTPQGTVTQTRTFNYDRRGFLNWETHPETAPNVLNAGHHKDYLGYDSRGHFHRTVEGGNDLSYNYDTAERPTLVYNTANGPNCSPTPISMPTCVKQWSYYQDSASGALGRLYQASRFNHILYFGQPHTDQWTYTYTYGGPDGRLSQRALQHTFDGHTDTGEESFVQAWSYTQLGQVDTETYPYCASSFTNCSGVTTRAVQNSYTNGLLTGVNGYTTGAGITYYQNGMVASVTHANNVTATYGADPFGMPRPASITAATPSGTLWSTGPYAYDGAGSATQMGHAGYNLYDGVSRLTMAVVQTNPIDNPTAAANATVSQSVSYDAFGNIQAFVGSPGNSTPTDSRYNQLTGGTYDASGNLHGWNGASYDHDELNQLKHYKNGAQEWFYMYDADGERVWQLQPPINGLPRFDRWTLRGLDARVRRTFELYGYAWGNVWGGSNLWEDYVYRRGLLLASYSSNGYQRHVDVDHLGTPRLITTPGSGQGAGFYTLTPCRILDTRHTGAPLTQSNPQSVYQVSGACGVPANAQAVSLNVTLVGATTNLSVQGYPGDLPAPGAPGTNVVSASPSGHATIASFAVLPLATNGSGTLGVLMTLAPPATSGQADLLLDVSGYFAPASTASVVAYHAYLPFGAEATYFAQDFERMKFTGHERDLADPSSPADDLDYMHARHYNFLTGRFLSIDKLGGKPPAPQSWNRYSYAWDNPLRLVDLTGEEPLDYSVRIGIQSFYGVDFSGVEVHGGFFARALTGILGAIMGGEVEGVTIGHQMFLSPSSWSQYQSIHGGDAKAALYGITLVAHELTHTAQAQEHGLTVLAVRYLYDLARLGYVDNPFEAAARAQAALIAGFLETNPEFLEAIMSGPAIEPLQVKISQSPGVCCWSDASSLFGGLLGGWFQLSGFGGELWIDGVNLTGVLTTNGRR